METIPFNRDKFLNVIHYACSKCDPHELGRVKLHKILYFSDMLHFAETGEPLTGAEYQKQQFGPVAKHLGWGLDKLSEQGRVRVEKTSYFGYDKFSFFSERSISDNQFSHREKKLLDDVIDFVCDRSAAEISELSHNRAWHAAEMGETIPYFTAYDLFPCEITGADLDWGHREAERVLAQRR